MFRVLSLAVVLALVVGVAPRAQGNVSGAWELNINGPQGAITAGANLKQDGENVTGTIDSPQGTAEMKGTFKGKTLLLEFSIQGPDGPLDIRVNGEVEGDSIKGMLDFGMGQADFTGAKKQ
ncbi:MAG: hypothetical protein AB7P34_12535 [Vicinamibacterales bacterium]